MRSTACSRAAMNTGMAIEAKGSLMFFAVYTPSWEGAVRALPWQCILVGALALALFIYVCPRHGLSRSVIGLGAGFGAGLVTGFAWTLWNWWTGGPVPGLSSAKSLE